MGRLLCFSGSGVKEVAFNNDLGHALILNASYEPIKIISWQKAILLWLQERVEVLDFHAIQVHSVTQSFPLPSVMKLKKYINFRGSHGVRLTRLNVFLRDDHECQYCRKHFSKKDLTIDHVIPLSKGGDHRWENVVTACHKCNNKKGNKSLSEYGFYPKNPPVEPKWLPNTELKYKTRAIPEAWLPYIDLEGLE